MVLIGLFMLATVVALIAGLVVFAIGGETNKKWGNRLMTLRVTMQALAVVLLGLMFASGASH